MISENTKSSVEEIEAYAFRVVLHETIGEAAKEKTKKICDQPGFLGCMPDSPEVVFLYKTAKERDSAFNVASELFDWVIIEPRPAYFPAEYVTDDFQKKYQLEEARALAKTYHINPKSIYIDDNGELHTPPAFDRLMKQSIEDIKTELESDW